VGGGRESRAGVNPYKLKGSFFNAKLQAAAVRMGRPLFYIMLAAKNARAQRA